MPPQTLIAAGELLVEFVSHRKDCGLREIAEYSGPYPSGAPAIFADQAARCGARSVMLGSVGKDGFGGALIDRLKSDGVDTSAIRELADKSTGAAFVSYFSDGSRTFIFHIAGTAADAVDFDPRDLPAGELVFHVSGASLGNPRLRALILAAADSVRERGGSISCDPNARPELMRDDAARAALDRMVSISRYLLPSTSDLDFLFPGQDESAVIENLLANRAEVVALKRGPEGAVVFADDRRFDIAPHAVTEIDPTGAGDCFCGTFMACLINGRPGPDGRQFGPRRDRPFARQR